jgi:hypothetical protein
MQQLPASQQQGGGQQQGPLPIPQNSPDRLPCTDPMQQTGSKAL